MAISQLWQVCSEVYGLATEILSEKDICAPARANILIVDDEEDQLELFAYVLREANYSVETASDVNEGISALKQGNIDCVVCDVFMPQTNGRVFTQYIRTQSSFRHIPIIMLTAGSEDIELDLIACGADMFCHKGHAIRRLVAQIELLLK